jgi:hypothetical protein
MRILYTGLFEEERVTVGWRERGAAAEFIRDEGLLGVLRGSLNTNFTADAIVFVAYPHHYKIKEETTLRILTTSLDAVERLAIGLTKLDPSCAMIDGRKWNAVPFIVIGDPEVDKSNVTSHFPSGVTYIPLPGRNDPVAGLEEIREVVTEYDAVFWMSWTILDSLLPMKQDGTELALLLCLARSQG